MTVFCIHMNLFKCYNTVSFECQCVEIPLHKGDSPTVSALHRNHRYSIPEEGSLSLVQMYAIVPDIQVKHTKKPKQTTFKRDPWSCRVTFLSSGKRVIILMSAWAESVAHFKTNCLWIKTCKYYLTPPATQVTHRSTYKYRHVCVLYLF